MFERIRSDFECLKGQDQNSNVSKDRTRISMFEGIRSKYLCLEGLG